MILNYFEFRFGFVGMFDEYRFQFIEIENRIFTPSEIPIIRSKI
jgi:hypothetical protein